MNADLLNKLYEVTDEEKDILAGNKINKSIYTETTDFTVDSAKISEWEKLIDIRKHTRFAPFPKHKHNYIELIYNCSGETVHRVNDSEKITLGQGELLLLGTNAVHEVDYAGEKDIAVNFIIKPEFFSTTMGIVGYGNTIYNYIMSELSLKGDAGYILFKVAEVLPIQNLIENLIYSLYFAPNRNYASQNLTMGLIFSELSNETENFDVQPLRYEREIALKTAQYIENSYRDAKLSVISEELHISQVSLCKIIKKSLGSTFKNLLQKKRLAEAEKLIKNTDIPITEIIYSVGYENTNFFYKLFSEQFHCSPKTYRQIYAPKNAMENSVVNKIKKGR